MLPQFRHDAGNWLIGAQHPEVVAQRTQRTQKIKEKDFEIHFFALRKQDWLEWYRQTHLK